MEKVPAADDGRLQQEGFRVKSGKLAHPFGRTEYDGMLGKTPVAVTVGLKFGSPFCELYFPKAPKSRFEALRKALRSSIGIDGEPAQAGFFVTLSYQK